MYLVATQRKMQYDGGTFHCVKLKADYSRTLNQIPRASQGFPCLSWNTKITTALTWKKKKNSSDPCPGTDESSLNSRVILN